MRRRNRNIVTELLERWRAELRELFTGLTRDPFAKGHGRHWDRDFTGEVETDDVHYSIFLVLLSLIPAAIVAFFSTDIRWRVMAQFFGAPLQAVISGFLTASLIFLGSHVNRVPRPWPVAYKLMLRIMSIYPLLGFFMFSRWGAVLMLLVYGLFVIRGVRKTYSIPLQNALLFFGVIYVVFAILQLQSIVSPPKADALKYFS